MKEAGKSPRGRPERRFMDAIKDDMGVVEVREEKRNYLVAYD